jgi:hypothetical protein
MLTEAELAAWYQRLNFSESTRAVIDQVRRSDPARRGFTPVERWA